jgi:hypothetical protein
MVMSPNIDVEIKPFLKEIIPPPKLGVNKGTLVPAMQVGIISCGTSGARVSYS